MKKIVSFLILLLLLPLCVEARTTTVVVGQGTAAAGGPDAWYYSGAGTDPQGDDAFSDGQFAVDDITIGQGGNITQIGVKLKSGGTGPIKLCLATGSWTMVSGSCKTIATATQNAWNDVTIDTPTAVNTNDVVRVYIFMGGSVYLGYTNTTGGWYGSATYATACTDALPSGDADYDIGVRVYVD